MKEGIHPKYEEVVIRCACGRAQGKRHGNGQKCHEEVVESFQCNPSHFFIRTKAAQSLKALS